jgi:hypothetical protein
VKRLNELKRKKKPVVVWFRRKGKGADGQDQQHKIRYAMLELNQVGGCDGMRKENGLLGKKEDGKVRVLRRDGMKKNK